MLRVGSPAPGRASEVHVVSRAVVAVIVLKGGWGCFLLSELQDPLESLHQ